MDREFWTVRESSQMALHYACMTAVTHGPHAGRTGPSPMGRMQDGQGRHPWGMYDVSARVPSSKMGPCRTFCDHCPSFLRGRSLSGHDGRATDFKFLWPCRGHKTDKSGPTGASGNCKSQQCPDASRAPARKDCDGLRESVSTDGSE